MKYSIENDFLKIGVQENGAELCSVVSRKSGTEYMWGADPEVWGSHAPVLFPVIGQVRPEGHTHDGKRFHLPRHGFVRKNNKLKAKQEINSISFVLEADKETLAVYPFLFRFTLRYRLENNVVWVEHEIENLGDKDMFFSLGGHPAFRCPLHANESYDDYYLEMEQVENAEKWLVRKDGLVDTKTLPFFENTKVLPLHQHLFDNDALVFKTLKSESISLKSKKSEQVLKVSYSGFPYMGIWAKPKADFVCIEPWLGIACHTNATDVFSEKEGLVKLAAKKTYKASYSISIDE